MEIVFLEKGSLGNDLDLSYFSELGHVTFYELTKPEEVPERIRDADVIIVNKIPMNEATLSGASHLKLVALTATGMNNIDFDYTNSHGIQVKNVAGYSTNAVAQHTFALLFYVLHRLAYYDNYVKSGAYCTNPGFSHFDEKFSELDGKTWGIVGMGAIGQRVASIAEAFGCHVIYYSTSGNHTEEAYERVDFDTLLTTSDIVSVHAPLTEQTEHLMNAAAFAKMKQNAIFINVGRGPIVVEADLADALEQGTIAAAGLDVLSVEPMREDNPLRRIKDSERLVITPHIAWAAVETRKRLMEIILQQVKEFFERR